MFLRPPISTLFPTRRSSDLDCLTFASATRSCGRLGPANDGSTWARSSRRWLDRAVRKRSEEHTSELQSRQYLVCRLLLEKKKKHKNRKLAIKINTKTTQETA